MYRAASLLFAFAASAYAQQAGTLKSETRPSLPMQSCSAGGSCTTIQTSIVLDANWRWLHSTLDSTNCYTGGTWNATLCPDGATCAANCALDGADYNNTYGITSSGNSLRMNLVTNTNVGSRVYLMDTDSTYKLFKIKGQEFTFDIDASNLPCGLNGALYFSEMPADGGMSGNNMAGAKYGTGYCDAQCPRGVKFIGGVANSDGWSSDTATGNFGSCCTEMDIWEANKMSAAFTPHACSLTGQERCSGIDCGASAGSKYGGVCDPDGCDFNSYRMGNTSFYGPSMVVDTTRPFTVVTQFVTVDGTATGTLSQINRFYVQDGNVIPNSVSDITGITATNAISDAFCTQQKTAFGATNNSFAAHGGMSAIGDSMDRGQVLVLSIWDDHASNMFWLDSTTPAGSTSPGAARGPCPASGTAADVEASSPNPYVIYSNIKIGPIGSTFNAGAASPAKPLTPLSSASPTPLSSASPTPLSFAPSAPLPCTSSPAAAGSSTMSRW